MNRIINLLEDNCSDEAVYNFMQKLIARRNCAFCALCEYNIFGLPNKISRFPQCALTGKEIAEEGTCKNWKEIGPLE